MKYEYFDDGNDDDSDDDKPFPDYVLIKQESDTKFDDAETICCASPQRQNGNETEEKNIRSLS